eukprot:scaffold109116_cov66-Phaeocystis_antarctica.AAC.5
MPARPTAWAGAVYALYVLLLRTPSAGLLLTTGCLRLHLATGTSHVTVTSAPSYPTPDATASAWFSHYLSPCSCSHPCPYPWP